MRLLPESSGTYSRPLPPPWRALPNLAHALVPARPREVRRPADERTCDSGREGRLSRRTLRASRPSTAARLGFQAQSLRELEADEYFQEKFGEATGTHSQHAFGDHRQKENGGSSCGFGTGCQSCCGLSYSSSAITLGRLVSWMGKRASSTHVLWSFWYPFLVGVKIVERRACSEARGMKRSHVRENSTAALAGSRNQT